MKIEFKNMTISRSPAKGAPEPITMTSDQFSNALLNAEAALKGWKLSFSTSDHPVHVEYVQITDVQIVEERKVKVTVMIALKDNSGDWDDTYEGTANVLIMGVVADN